jgi:HEAT repeats
MTLKIFCLFLLLSFTSAAQITTEANNGPLPTIGESLRRHNVGLTQPDLIRALKSSDAEVRYLAALKLAENKATDALPEMLEALASEKVDLTKVNIALALGALGNDAGVIALQDGCHDRNWGAEARTEAAEYLSNLRPESTVCLNALMELAETAPTGYRIQALSIMPKLHDLNVEDSQKALEAVLNNLQASQPSMRIAASQAAVELGNLAAIPKLEKALAREQEEPVCSQIERDLTALREKRDRATPDQLRLKHLRKP